MNFKTTLILLVLLLGVGVTILLTKDTTTDPANETSVAKKVMSINGGDVRKLAIAPAGGKKLVFERDGMNWKITEPVTALADAGLVNAMVADLVGLESQTSTPVSDGSGLTTPRFVVDLTTTDGKTTTLSIGDRSGVGDRLYVQLKGNDTADLVATGVDEQLDKSLEELREKKLVGLGSDQVNYLAIETSAGKLEVARTGDTWKVTSPQEFPADSAAVSDVVLAVIGLSAVEFVDGSPTAATFGLAEGSRKVTIAAVAPSATRPTTQPTTQPDAAAPVPVTIVFGRPDTVLQENFFATVAGSNAVVKVPKSSTTFLDKKPFELRHKEVAHIEPELVNRLSVTIDRPATTQPVTRPGEIRQIAVARRSPPATQPATTQPSTQPVPSKWVIDSPEKPSANDSAIEAILSMLHPLRAEKYVETAPTGTVITLKLDTGGGGVWAANQVEIRFIDPGGSNLPVGIYNGVNFQPDRTLVEKLHAADFANPSAAPIPTTQPGPPEMGPMMP